VLPFAPDRPIQLELLGGVALRGAPDGDALLAQTKRVALVAYLALARPRGYHRRDVISTLFWPEQDTTSARTTLRKAVHAARQSLGESAILGRGDEELSLNPDLIWCDAIAMEAAAEAGNLARALELYRGELMPGFFADAPGFEKWLDQERLALREAAGRAAMELASQFEKDANLTMASRWARKAARLVFHEERAVRKMMQLLGRAGARADAIGVYEEYAKHLRDELEIDPSAETRALAQELRGA
jgi:DNA-binding SARP family transcriptional activator